MNRRNLFKGAAALAASALILPERRVWALDQTMLLPPQPSQGGMLWWAEQVANSVTYTNPTIQDLEAALNRRWVIRHRGPEDTFAPWHEVFGFNPGIPGSGFTIKYDAAMGKSWMGEHLAQDIHDAIASQEWQARSLGTAGLPEQVLPGFGYTAPYNAPLKDAEETSEPVWDEWWR